MACFEDEDGEVRCRAARFVFDLRAEHLDVFAPLLESFVTSRAYLEGAHWYHEFLFKHGSLKPSWTLAQIESIFGRAEHPAHRLRRFSGDELMRCIIRLYMLPDADEEVRSQAMRIFGTLLKSASYNAQRTLSEWDEGRYS